ncbi:MAG TPA: hypothetical protein VGM34_02520 [Chlamydiales bacterium]
MIIFKFVFLLTTFLGVSMNADGWVNLERPKQEPFSIEEIDPSIWVVFAKKMGAEKFLVRFPEDPTYRYLDEKKVEMEIFTVSEAKTHRLHIKPAEDAPGMTEKSYWQDGFWVFERMLTTKHNSYFFQTKTISIDLISHRQFIDSFDVETAR